MARLTSTKNEYSFNMPVTHVARPAAPEQVGAEARRAPAATDKYEAILAAATEEYRLANGEAFRFEGQAPPVGRHRP